MSDIFLGSDHAGFELKEKIQSYLKDKGYHVVDLGVFTNDTVDYPDIAHELSEKVCENKQSFGILMCGTGIGMCMAANRTKGIRAVGSETVQSAEMSRKHNDANVLCLGGRTLSFETAKEILDSFIATSFDGEERHARRVRKIDK